MNDKPYEKIGDFYFPKKKERKSEQNRIQENYWEAWHKEGIYFFKFDIGHFVSKFITVKITRQEFEDLRSGDISDKDLATKYS